MLTGAAAAAAESDNEDDQEAVDMEAFIESGMMEDEATVDAESSKKSLAKKTESSSVGGEIVNARTYDLNITYDIRLNYCFVLF